MGKDYMTVKGIKKGNKGSLYCDWPGDEDGIFYFQDKVTGFLIRQILPQDLELVKKYRLIAASQVIVSKEVNGKKIYMSYDKIMEESDQEVLNLINEAIPKNNENGDISLIVFNIKTKEFIAMLDVMQVGKSEEAVVGFTFSTNEVIRRRSESKLKSRIKELLIDEKICKSMKEEVWNTQKGNYELIPM